MQLFAGLRNSVVFLFQPQSISIIFDIDWNSYQKLLLLNVYGFQIDGSNLLAE